MFQIADHQFHHDRVVQKPNARNPIRNQVFWFGEIGHRVNDSIEVFALQLPFLVLQHLHQQIQLFQPACNKLWRVAVLCRRQQLARRGRNFTDISGGLD